MGNKTGAVRISKKLSNPNDRISDMVTVSVEHYQLEENDVGQHRRCLHSQQQVNN